MFKKLNKKGFTLIELLAVIIILAILIAVAVPAVTRYLDGARKDTFVTNAKAAIQAVSDDRTINGMQGSATDDTYTLETINNKLLDTKLVDSPYGSPYAESSYVKYDADSGKYYICLVDGKGNGIAETEYASLTRESVTTEVTCTTPTGA